MLSIPAIESIHVAAGDFSSPQSRDAQLREEVMGQLLSGSQVVISDALVDRRIDQMIDQFKTRLTENGVSFEQYLHESRKDEALMRHQLRQMAFESIKKEAVLLHVAETAGIRVLAEDVDQAIGPLAGMWGLSPKAALERLDKEGRTPALVQAILFEKVTDLLMRTATGG